MLRIVRLMALSLALAGGAATLTGCSGGNAFVQTGVARYAGTYNGIFTGTIQSPSPGAGQTVGGTFTAVADSQGNLTGTVTQPGVGQFAATGTIDSNGTLRLVAQPTANQSSTLSGAAVINGSSVTLSGTFTTLNSGFAVVTGTFSGNRQ